MPQFCSPPACKLIQKILETKARNPVFRLYSSLPPCGACGFRLSSLCTHLLVSVYYSLMKKALSLSIVIPVYNEASSLPQCLKAIAAQTLKPDEVIVVDNNSTDRTVEVTAQYKFVTLINEKQQGVQFVARAGFDEAKSEIICRIDADTRLPENWLAQVQDYFLSHESVAAVTGDCYFYDFPFKRTFRIIHHLVYYSLQKAISGTEILWGSNMAIRKTAWQAVKSDCLAIPKEDIDLSLHLQDKGYKIKRLPELVAGVSLLHGNVSPINIVVYLWPWPKTYWVNNRYPQAILIGVLLCLLVLPLSIIVFAIAMLRKLF